MMLTPEEKQRILSYIAGWSTKSVFEGGIIEDEGDAKWDEVGEFLEECEEYLKRMPVE